MFIQRARFAAFAAVILIIFATGAVAGANGAAFILGSSSNSATLTTKLSANFNGNAFAVSQTNVNATANGIRGDSSAGSGGVFTSTSNNALFGLAASGNRFGVVAKNTGAGGTGAGLFADGGNNNAIVATSAETTAITGAGNCTGFLCGVTGISGTSSGFFGAGVAGSSSGLGSGVNGSGFAGVFGSGTAFGVEGSASTSGGWGVYATNSAANGLLVESGGVANTIDDNCDGSGSYYCGGARFAGSGDVIVSETDGAGGAYAVSGRDNSCSTTCTGYAFEGFGRGYFTGSVTALGGYFGPTGAVAVNGSTATLKQGQAVTLLGVKASPLDGTPLLVVGPAKKGDTVIGVANTQMTLSPETTKVTVPARTVKDGNGKDVKIPARTITQPNSRRGFVVGDTQVAAGQYLSIVTSGVVTFGSADASAGAIKSGDGLTVGASPGLLVKANKVNVGGQSFTIPGTSAGYALGSLNDGTGRIAILVSPH